MLRFLTAGESHGPGLMAVIEGLPAGLELTEDEIAADLRRRQGGYGRGGRMQIERDRAQITAGLHQGVTTGSPLGLSIENKDWANWKDRQVPAQTVPRPGHAELAGALKYGHEDVRIISERASARNTATLVAVGAVARRLLAEVGATVFSQVIEIGGVRAEGVEDVTVETQHAASLQSASLRSASLQSASLPLAEILEKLDNSDLRCLDAAAEQTWKKLIDQARDDGESLGGIFEVYALDVPPGLGSYVHWDRRLDGKLAQAVMSIQAIKGVEIGEGFRIAARRGTEAHDGIFVEGGAIVRHTNNAGGVEGGMSNGEPIVIRAAMKPIPTTVRPQPSVDLHTRQPAASQYQRSDVCAVPAAAVVGEAMVAWVIADALMEKFGGDTIEELKRRVSSLS